MIRAIIGLIKGLIVGGGVGYALLRLAGDGEMNSIIGYGACALVGALVGIVCGKAPWRSETIWTPVVKAIVGGIIGTGLCAVARHFLPDPSFTIADMHLSLHQASVLATGVGAIYGTFVEVDDGGKAEEPKPGSAKPARS